jgi:transcriptional antiterminator NusG
LKEPSLTSSSVSLSKMPEIDNTHDEVEESQASEALDPETHDSSVDDESLESGEDFATLTDESPAEDASALESEADQIPAEEAAVDETEETKHWYIIHTYSGFERKVAESLRTRADAFGFSEQIGQILIPEEEVVELRNGKKVTSKRLLYPGYVVVQMEMNDELWHRVKDTPRVTGFVGGGQTPIPLSADEINKMLYRQTNAAERPRPKMTFEKGELVRIIDGPFANFQGKVDEINPERNTLRVLVTIFGRATPVELDFLQVEKTA